jgi:hypothetical protein
MAWRLIDKADASCFTASGWVSPNIFKASVLVMGDNVIMITFLVNMLAARVSKITQ